MPELPKPKSTAKQVWVEMREGKPYLILKHLPSADEKYVRMPYSEAALSIRQQVFDRAAGHCELCSAGITWETGERHEKVWRGRGGEIGVPNCLAVCKACHRREHASRAPRFGARIAAQDVRIADDADTMSA